MVSRSVSASPDAIETHTAHFCEHCHNSLSDADIVGFAARQVVDIPELQMETVEHRAMHSQCPHCDALTQAQFPVYVDDTVQYGHRIKALSVDLKNYPLIPYARQNE